MHQVTMMALIVAVDVFVALSRVPQQYECVGPASPARSVRGSVRPPGLPAPVGAGQLPLRCTGSFSPHPHGLVSLSKSTIPIRADLS